MDAMAHASSGRSVLRTITVTNVRHGGHGKRLNLRQEMARFGFDAT
jgi:hypothetical protein